LSLPTSKSETQLATKRVHRAADAIAADFAARIARGALTLLGGLVVVLGILIAPLPGPMGLPVVVIGLMLILRNSFKARRQFVRFQHAHPRIARPIRRLLRRDQEVILFFWEQLLRLERLLLPRSWRHLVKLRHRFRQPRSTQSMVR